MIQVNGSSQCEEWLLLFLLDLYPLVKISIIGNRGQIVKLTRKYLLEKVQEFLIVHGDGCEILNMMVGCCLDQIESSNFFAPRLSYQQPKFIQR